MRKLTLSIVFILILFSGFTQTRFIPASNEDFRYVGRFDTSNPKEVRFDWSGVYIQFNIRSKECALRMSDTGHNYYNVFIDDQPSKTIDIKSDTTVSIATGLGSQIHKIQIYKRTEGNSGHRYLQRNCDF